ncbi:MAG TPA: hypothetical protein VLH85_10270 [Levilinea sp.]|nr:hypothetical protein [Levilinea sp.]
MAAPTGTLYAVGAKHARVYALNANGVPAATAHNVPYEGVQIPGLKAFEMTIPDARRIAHVGDDAVQAQDILPRTEVSSGVIRFAGDNHAAYAVFTGTKVAEIGDASVIGYATNLQGYEPAIALLVYQQAKSGTTRVWRNYLVPNAQAIFNPSSMNENPAEYAASLIPSAANAHVWGKAFTDGTEGYTQAEIVETTTTDIPHIAAWKGNGAALDFPFHASRQSTKVHAACTIAADGTVTDVTAGVGSDASKIAVAGPVANTTIVVCFYSYAAAV